MSGGFLNIIQFKSRFFNDLDKIRNAEERAARQALSRFGAFVRTRARSSMRTRARSSMRKRKKASEPGSPPSAHVGFIKKFLYFAYEKETKNVVIGPALLGTAKGNKTVPELHEYGGDVDVKEQQLSGGLWVGSGRVKVNGRPLRTRNVNYPSRPFMRPAWEAELPKAAMLFKNSIR